MKKIDQPVTITGKAVAIVSKSTRFDPAEPQKTQAHEFVLLGEYALTKDGKLTSTWAKDYRHVGMATITVELLPIKGMLKQAVAALETERTTLQADTQKRLTEIEGEIQKLLAITYDAEVQS